MNIKQILILIYTFIIFNIYSHEEKYLYRDISKPIIAKNPNNKIIILSPPRTGSTLVYITFQYLFETKLDEWNSFNKTVIKSHSIQQVSDFIKSSSPYIIVTIRNPYNSLLSRIRLLSKINSKNIKAVTKDHVNFHKNLLQFIKTAPNEKLLIVYYEDFYTNYDNLISEIEKKFNVKITNEEKNKMKIFFSKESVQKISNKFKNFDEFDPIMGIHGSHISQDNKKLEHYIKSKKLLKFVKNNIESMSLDWKY